MKLGRALIVAPVADPDDIALRARGGKGAERAGVGGFVPGEGALGPAALEIYFSQNVAEGEDAVVAGKVVGGHRGGIGDGAVVGVVEEEVVAFVFFVMLANAADEGVVVPFVDQ